MPACFAIAIAPSSPNTLSNPSANAVRPFEVLTPSRPILCSSLGMSPSLRPSTKFLKTVYAPSPPEPQPSAKSFDDILAMFAKALSLSPPIPLFLLKLFTAWLISLNVLTTTPRASSGAIFKDANEAESPITCDALRPAALATAPIWPAVLII